MVAICALALVVLLVHALTRFGGVWAERVIEDGLSLLIELIGAGACLVRAARLRDRRLAWTLTGVAILCWAVGDTIWGLARSGRCPANADIFYTAFYPLCLAGLGLLLSGERARLARRMWIDGAIAGLAVGALGVAFAYEPILHAAARVSTEQTAVHLAYPIADMVVIGFVLSAFAMHSWRPGRGWTLLGIGAAGIAIADTIYLYQSAHGTFDDDSPLSALWPAALLCCGWAAWQPWRGARPEHGFGRQAFAVPVAFAGLAVALLAYGQFAHVPPAAALLAIAALVLATVRAGWTFRENMRLLQAARVEALSDGLTGLPNRRRLMVDLERAIADSRHGRPRTLVFFDLDGFKRYNDTFGHAAGDLLLGRLAERLRVATATRGRAYRLGGDEFCALLVGRIEAGDPLLAACVAALAERGEGFSVGASHGSVAIPEEADTATHALQVADQRMYAEKDDTRESSRRQTSDVLMQVLRERAPELHDHSDGVTALALATGRRLRLSAEQIDELVRAAELHDVGKLAVPDAILDKPGPLEESEWQLMRQHTVVGDRILGAAPAMRPVARIVRASHERWDGTGYPDRLAGEQIPLGARIVAVCDAFSAMTSERPYQRPLGVDAAIAELRRCAGSQFDPTVVDAFCAVVLEAAGSWPGGQLPGRGRDDPADAARRL